MYSYPYPRPMVSVDLAVFRLAEGRVEVLLIRRGHPPFEGMWAIPGGFVEMDEGLEAAAERELVEETGVRGVRPFPVGTFGDPHRDPRDRVITAAFAALVPPAETDRLKDARAGDDAAALAWHSVGALPPLAFDHDRILAAARAALAARLFGAKADPTSVAPKLDRASRAALKRDLPSA